MPARPELRIEPLTLTTRHAFGLSRGSEQRFHNLLLRIRWDGIEALGEVAPSAYYGERAELARESVPLYWEAAREIIPALLESAEPLPLLEDLQLRWDGVLRRNGAARAGLDMALWDLWGKARGESAGAHWRRAASALKRPSTSYTIAIDSPRTLDARLEASHGFPVLKVKLGGPDDAGTLSAIRSRTERLVRVDANCAWTGPEATARLAGLIGYGVEMIEQPCRPRDLEGLASVRAAFSVPVYADESAETLEDVAAVAGRVDGINVKLVKCGGPTPALGYIRKARELGLEVMLGCMIETSLAITAAAHLAPLADRLDLDGALLLAEDPFEGVRWEAGLPALPDGPGLGVTPKSARSPRP